MNLKQEDQSTLDDDGGPQLVAIEGTADEPSQALWVRVGPVYYDEIADQPGIWIEYQPRYMQSDLQGPVLLTFETWDRLDKAVRARVARFNKANYGSVSQE